MKTNVISFQKYLYLKEPSSRDGIRYVSHGNLLLQKCISAPPSAGTEPLLLALLEMEH